MSSERHVNRDPFPTFIKQWREFRGLTQTEVEKRLGWSDSRVSHLENGRATITAYVLATLAQTYDCTVADLITRDPGADVPPSAAVDEHGAGESVAAISEALAALDRVLANVGHISTRVDELGKEIAEGRQRVARLQELAAILAATLERFAGSLRPAPPVLAKTNEPINDG